MDRGKPSKGCCRRDVHCVAENSRHSRCYFGCDTGSKVHTQTQSLQYNRKSRNDRPARADYLNRVVLSVLRRCPNCGNRYNTLWLQPSLTISGSEHSRLHPAKQQDDTKDSKDQIPTAYSSE